jgi:hypothetical protein
VVPLSSSGPAAAHMGQLKRLAIKIAQVRWWSEEISSAGTLTKVAQYEVLGNEAKNRSVPLGTIEMLGFGLARGSAIASIRRSSRPGRIAL